MIELNNLTKTKVNEDFLKGLAKKVIKRENKITDISIVLVGEKRIKDLNKKYRKEDKVTDVLSFGQDLNEIIICPSFIKDKKDLAEALIHGVLHVLGYEHSDEMFKKQDNYLDKFYG